MFGLQNSYAHNVVPNPTDGLWHHIALSRNGENLEHTRTHARYPSLRSPLSVSLLFNPPLTPSLLLSLIYARSRAFTNPCIDDPNFTQCRPCISAESLMPFFLCRSLCYTFCRWKSCGELGAHTLAANGQSLSSICNSSQMSGFRPGPRSSLWWL